MTQEEAREILNILKEYERAYQYSKEEVVGALDMAIQALEQQRWHLASEEPPKKDTDYIITYQWKGSWSGDIYTEVCVSGYHGDGLWDLGNHKVLAWRELPLPYKEYQDVCKDCYYNDGEVHAECVICDKAESEG